MVSLLGRRPLTPFRTGSGGSGVGKRYEDCMERRVCLDGEDEKEDEADDEGADSGFGRVTAKKGNRVRVRGVFCLTLKAGVGFDSGIGLAACHAQAGFQSFSYSNYSPACPSTPQQAEICLSLAVM